MGYAWYDIYFDSKGNKTYDIDMAIKSLKSGAFEFIQKPLDKERLMNFIKRAVENLNLKIENENLENKLFHTFDLIGKSQNTLSIKDWISALKAQGFKNIKHSIFGKKENWNGTLILYSINQ